MSGPFCLKMGKGDAKEEVEEEEEQADDEEAAEEVVADGVSKAVLSPSSMLEALSETAAMIRTPYSDSSCGQASCTSVAR